MSLTFDNNGMPVLNSSDDLDKNIERLVTSVFYELSTPAPSDVFTQLALFDWVISRLRVSFLNHISVHSVDLGQGSDILVTKKDHPDALKILEDTIDTAFEKAENGWGNETHAHDMLQTFSRMVDYAKKGESYFSDDEDDESYSVHTEGDGESPYGANAR